MPMAVRPLDRLVMLQHADGFWELSAALANIVGQPLAQLGAVLPTAENDAAHTGRIWATALALAYLELHAPDERDEWVLLAEKARRWLAGCSTLSDRSEWIARATRLLQSLAELPAIQ